MPNDQDTGKRSHTRGHCLTAFSTLLCRRANSVEPVDAPSPLFLRVLHAPMPSLGSGYTFADFLLRLQRSPVAHMAPLYHAHKALFVHRPDMFSKTVMSVDWEKAVALVKTAYYTQPVAAETYRAVLARMLVHNRHVQESGAGQLVDWRAALEVYSEAVLAHGTALPSRVTLSALRLLAVHRQWERSLRLLQVAQVNDQLTKPMLIDTAHACASPAAWSTALGLLMHLHAQDPALLTETIQGLRPAGTDLLSAATSTYSLLPASAPAAASGSVAGTGEFSQAQQQHLLRVLNDVVSCVPGDQVLKNELCFSYVSHLVASTTLPPEQKARMLASALQPMQWQQALALLVTFAEPNLLTDEEWQTASASFPQLPPPADPVRRAEKAAAPKGRRHTRRKGKSRGTTDEAASPATPITAQTESTVLPAPLLTPTSPVATAVAPPVVELVPALRDRLQWLHGAPGAVSALLAALVSKLPADVAADFVRAYLRADATAQTTRADGAVGGVVSSAADSASRLGGLSTPLGISAGRHPVVVQALLRTCTTSPDGWRTAVPLLLEQSGAHLPTPTDVLSELVLTMRSARQPALVVKLLNDHIVPSGSRLTPPAVEALLECVLAHNRACHQTILTTASDGGGGDVEALWTSVRSLQGQTVHWLSALSWATDLQADVSEQRIIRTGTGPSAGAHSRKPSQRVEETKTLSAAMLNLLLGICVDAGQPLAALRTLGAARNANKLELQSSEQIRALLYCVLYERPFEAKAIVTHAEKISGEQLMKPLRQLLHLAQLAKEREAAVRHLAARAEDADSQI